MRTSLETLDSLTKTQNLLFNKIQTLENKVNNILNILKSKEQQIRFSTKELDKLTTQLSKLDLGKTTSQTSNQIKTIDMPPSLKDPKPPCDFHLFLTPTQPRSKSQPPP